MPLVVWKDNAFRAAVFGGGPLHRTREVVPWSPAATPGLAADARLSGEAAIWVGFLRQRISDIDPRVPLSRPFVNRQGRGRGAFFFSGGRRESPDVNRYKILDNSATGP